MAVCQVFQADVHGYIYGYGYGDFIREVSHLRGLWEQGKMKLGMGCSQVLVGVPPAKAQVGLCLDLTLRRDLKSLSNFWTFDPKCASNKWVSLVLNVFLTMSMQSELNQGNSKISKLVLNCRIHALLLLLKVLGGKNYDHSSLVPFQPMKKCFFFFSQTFNENEASEMNSEKNLPNEEAEAGQCFLTVL